MAKPTQDTLIDAINGLEDLSATDKKRWVTRIQKEGITAEVKDDLYTLLRKKDDDDFAEFGLPINEKDPEYKQAERTMLVEVKNAEADFKRETAGIQKEIEHIQKGTAKEMDGAMIVDAREKIKLLASIK